MGWVKTQPCAARYLGPCDGVIEADHAGRRGIGQKAPDNTCIPLCSRHHRQRHSFVGVFNDWTQITMRAWLELEVSRTQEAYVLSGGNVYDVLE